MRIVANNFWGFFNNCEIISNEELFFCSSASKSVGEREKRATSAPEIKAEQPKRKIKTSALMSKFATSEDNSCLIESISKIQKLVIQIIEYFS